MASRRRIARWLAAAGALVVVLALAAGAVTQTAAFRDWLRREVVRRVNAGLAGTLAIGSLDGNLYGRLVARDLRLTIDGRRALAIRRVEATYDALALLWGGGLRLATVDADGVVLQLVEDEQGWNLARLAGPSESKRDATSTLALDEIRIRHGTIRVIRPTEVWRLRDLAVTGSARFSPVDTDVTITALAFREMSRRVELLETAGRVVVTRTGALAVEGARLRTARSRLALDATIGPADDRKVDAHVELANLDAGELARLLGERAPVSDFAGALHAAGPAAAVAVTGEIHARSDAAGVPSEHGAIGVAGTLDLSGEVPGGELRATLTGVDVGGILGRGAPPSDLTGTVRIASAPSLPRGAEVAVDLRRPRVAATTLASLVLTGNASADAITFDATAATETGAAHATGTVAPRTERFDVQVTARDLDLAPLSGRPELGGRLNATVAATGEGFAPRSTRARVHATLAPSRVGAVAIGGGEITGQAEAGRLVVERVNVVANVGTATAAGELALEPSGEAGPGDLRGEITIRDLRPLAALLGQPDLTGAASLKVRVQGRAGALQADASVAAPALAGRGWRIERLEGTLAAAEVGSAGAHGELRARAPALVVNDRRVSDVDLVARWQGAATAGRGSVELEAREDDRRHRLAAEVAARDGETRASITQLRYQADAELWSAVGTPLIVLRGDRLTVDDFVLRSERGTARIRGTLDRTGANDLTLAVDGLDVRVLEGLVPEDVTGTLVGRVRLGGTLAVPRLDAEATLGAPTFGGATYRELQAHLTVGDGRAEVHARLAESEERGLWLDGAVPARFTLAPARFEPTGNLDARFRAAAIDLAFLGTFVPGLVTKTGGVLDADVAITGPPATPDARGTISVEGGRAYVVPVGLTYDPIALTLRLEGRAASIDRLVIASGKGRLSGGGGARLSPDGPIMDARFEAQAFPLFANQYGHGAASGWLWISGPTTAPVLQGSLATDGLVLQIPEALPSAARPPDPTIVVVGPGAPTAVAEHAPAAPPPAPRPGFFERAAITVQLAVPNNAWVRRSDANIELEGWLTAWKKPGEELQLSGEIRGVRGWYAFQGKKFTLEDGRVRFTGQSLDPVLDIAALYKAREHLVRLRVGGTITKPSLKLESEPALPQADVLSVLLFGAPADGLNREQSIGLREQALGIAGGYVASELRQSVANALGVDDLQFDTGTAGLQDAKVSVGKYVAQDIFVSLAHRFGAEGGEEVRIEYRFRPGWSLETSTDTFGQSGIDVFWKRRY